MCLPSDDLQNLLPDDPWAEDDLLGPLADGDEDLNEE